MWQIYLHKFHQFQLQEVKYQFFILFYFDFLMLLSILDIQKVFCPLFVCLGGRQGEADELNCKPLQRVGIPFFRDLASPVFCPYLKAFLFLIFAAIFLAARWSTHSSQTTFFIFSRSCVGIHIIRAYYPFLCFYAFE